MPQFTFGKQGDVYLRFGHSDQQSHSPKDGDHPDVEGKGRSRTKGCTNKKRKKQPDNPPLIEMRASSTVLKSHSRVFRAMLENEHMIEGQTLRKTGRVHITLQEDNPDAFLIIMNILYQRHKRIPAKLDAITFAWVATIVDKYEFHDDVERQVQRWVGKSQIPSIFNDDMVLWLWISWVFHLRKLFKSLTEVVQKETREPVANPFAGEFWLPQGVIDAIDARRTDTLTRIQSFFISEIKSQLAQSSTLSKRNEWSKPKMLLRALELGYFTTKASEIGLSCHPTSLESSQDSFVGISLKQAFSVLQEMDELDGVRLSFPSHALDPPGARGTVMSLFRFGSEFCKAGISLLLLSDITVDVNELSERLERQPWGLKLSKMQ